MFKVKSKDYLSEMGFKKKDSDYIIQRNIDDINRILFKVYKGSPYIRVSRTGYVLEEQLKLIYDWAKCDFIEWEDE